MSSSEFSDLILSNILKNKENLKSQYNASKDQIGYFYLDNLLPEGLVHKFNDAFPKKEDMILKKSIKEDKYVAAQMNKYDPILEKIIYAFQDKRIVKEIASVCDLDNVYPDENLYAGGISMMGGNQFLNPHLDNSHDKDRSRWRVLNLLYYVSPDWEEEYGGNLELWPKGLKHEQITIRSKFNRLVIMATHNHSLHSVSPVTHSGYRKCVSNYYFADEPLLQTDTFHVTSFRARPNQNLKDCILKTDTWLRMNIRKVFKKGIVKNPHVYKKDYKQE